MQPVALPATPGRAAGARLNPPGPFGAASPCACRHIQTLHSPCLRRPFPLQIQRPAPPRMSSKTSSEGMDRWLLRKDYSKGWTVRRWQPTAKARLPPSQRRVDDAPTRVGHPLPFTRTPTYTLAPNPRLNVDGRLRRLKLEGSDLRARINRLPSEGGTTCLDFSEGAPPREARPRPRLSSHPLLIRRAHEAAGRSPVSVHE
jgi:hypothetical protein